MKRVFYSIASLFSLLAVVAVTGCNRIEPEMPVASDVPLSISTSILSSKKEAQNSITRASAELPSASKSAFVSGDQFGLYITRSVDTLQLGVNQMGGFNYSNLPYLHNGTQFTTSAGIPSGTIYFPYREVNVDLWGIYPLDHLSKNKVANAYPWSVQVNQSTEVKVLQSDFMVAHTKNVAPSSSSTPIDVQFVHKMTRLRLKLTVPVEIDGKTVNTVTPINKLYFEGTMVDGLYDFNLDTVNYLASQPVASIVPLARGSEAVNPSDALEGTYHYFEALVLPQKMAAGTVFLRLFVNYVGLTEPGLFVLELPSDMLLWSGKQHTYNVSFEDKFRLRLDGTKILDWDEASSVDVDIDEG